MKSRLPGRFVKPLLWLLAIAVVYLGVVQLLRAIAFGEEERTALALMEPAPPPPAGEGGFKYLGLHGYDIPLAELDAAMATEQAAYRAWHAGGADRLGQPDDVVTAWRSPLEDAYPARPPLEFPEGSCGLREPDCLARLRGNEAVVREWLAGEATRLDLAERALAADHLANPHPLAADTPLAGFQLLRLPLNAIALQALDGDVPGALDRACGLLAAERRFLRQDGMLIDKMIHGALLEGSAGLVLALRREDPAAPLSPRCAEALAPVEARDFLACSAFKHEHAMVATLAIQLDEAARRSWSPAALLNRWALTDGRLMRAWNAAHFAPMCSDAGQAAILAGDVPRETRGRTSWASVDFWAAPISRILGDIAMQSYAQYQERLLDHAASLRLHLAAIDAVGGGLAVDRVPATAASPGYTITVEEGHWVLPRRQTPGGLPPALRIALPPEPAPTP